MDIRLRIKKVLQEAEIYRSQGLIAEAYEKYKGAANLIHSIERLKNKQALLKAVTDKMDALNFTKEKVEKGPATPELSKKAQDLIKNLFTFSANKDEETATLEGAVALAKFGQFDRALAELNTLLPKENIRVEVAKNILRCHLAGTNADEAVAQYRQWQAGDIFQPQQLEAVRTYLEDILQKRGIDVALPSPLGMEEPQDTPINIEDTISEEPEEEFLDITSIGITFDSGPRKGKMVELDVNFQSGNMLSLIIAKKEQDLLDGLKEGAKLKEVQFYSPIAIFNGSGMIVSKTQIKAGPKQGDFCLDIRIVST